MAMALHHFFVGTFNTAAVFTLAFDTEERSLRIVGKSEATGAHSWLSLSADHTRLYATAWTEPPGLAAYRVIHSPGANVPSLRLINSVETRSRSGYCCNSSLVVYSAGGATGEVFKLGPEGGFLQSGTEGLLQGLEFVDEKGQKDDGGVMDFGGLRHGAHSVDLSADGKRCFIADMYVVCDSGTAGIVKELIQVNPTLVSSGRNCVFVYSVDEDGSLALTDKNIAPRPNDGPRHVTPHPNGRYVYSLQEHTSMVDIFEVSSDGKLTWQQGVKIIPSDHSPSLYWADEVRLSPSLSYLYASTRGLEPSTKGWVAVFPLSSSGLIEGTEPIEMWETPTSGGWANAIEPAPAGLSTLRKGPSGEPEGADYLALTDSEQGLVMVLSWDGKSIKEIARVELEGRAGAATAVWVD